MARITLASWQGIIAKLLWNYGKVQEGSTRCICAWLKMALTVSLLTFLWERPSAGADWIEAMARSLSAGDGINFQAIPRSFSSDTPHVIASTQQDINFLNTTLASNLIEANGPTDPSPTFTHAYINNGSLSRTGPFQLQLESDTIGTDLYQDLGQDRFIFANYHLTRSWELGMIVPLFFEPWPSWPWVTGGREEAGPGDIILQTQYKFPRTQLWWPDVMLRGQVKLPMGKAGFWGTGETDFK